MSKWRISILAGLALLAGCSTGPQRVAVAPPPAPVARAELPYHWTQGNAPKAWEEAVAIFGPLRLRPGQYRWAASIPETGDTRVVIDTLTQLLYVYRD
jgi:hypothetical protein